MNTLFTNKFGYTGDSSYIYHVEQLSITIKIKVMTQATMFSHKELEFYIHHISEYIDTAKNNGFKLIELKEWFDESSENEIPRLISFVFKK